MNRLAIVLQLSAFIWMQQFSFGGGGTLVFPSPSSTPQINSALLEELQTKAIPAWERMESFIDDIDIEYREVIRDRENGKNVRDHDPEGKRRMVWSSSRRVSKLISTAGDVHVDSVCNPDYGFDVGAATKEERLSLSGVEFAADLSPKKQFLEDGMPVYNSARRNVGCGCRILHYGLKSLLHDKDRFALQEVSELTVNGGRRILIVSRHLGEHIRVNTMPKGTYAVLIDPGRDYLIDTSQIEFREASYVIREHVEYRRLDGNPEINWFPAKYEGGGSYTVDKIEHSDEVYFEIPRKCTMPDSEFRLTHYGFSEEVLKTIKPNPWPRRWMILLGLAGLALAAWLVRSRRNS